MSKKYFLVTFQNDGVRQGTICCDKKNFKNISKTKGFVALSYTEYNQMPTSVHDYLCSSMQVSGVSNPCMPGKILGKYGTDLYGYAFFK